MKEWSGYPPMQDKYGLHVISSRIGRNPMVYKWLPDHQVWEGLNSNGNMKPEEAKNYTYVGQVFIK